MFSSTTGKWDTPQTVIDDLAEVFPWDLDVCASRPNVCPVYYTDAQNAFIQDWKGLCWMNPPYGRGIGQWIDRARFECGKFYTVKTEFGYTMLKTTVVCLVPARTDTLWWQRSAPWASLVVFIKGRLKFGTAKNSAPFPSAFMVFGTLEPEQIVKLSSYGWAVIRN